MARHIEISEDLLPRPVAQLLELFEARSDELRFPGVDSATLGACVDEVDTQAAELDKLQAQLDEAKLELDRRRKGLVELARRAHAYATVFATADETLQTELSQIHLELEENGRPVGSKTRNKVPRRSAAKEIETVEPPPVVERVEDPLADAPDVAAE